MRKGLAPFNRAKPPGSGDTVILAFVLETSVGTSVCGRSPCNELTPKGMDRRYLEAVDARAAGDTSSFAGWFYRRAVGLPRNRCRDDLGDSRARRFADGFLSPV